MKHTYIADKIFDGAEILNDVPLTVEDGRIFSLDTVNGVQETQVGGLLAPGFVDIQVNGGGGVLFNAAPTVEAINQIFSAHVQFGTTGFLPTLITDDLDVMRRAADAVSRALTEDVPAVLGIHFEGPHISVAKRGVHSENFIRELSEQELEIYARQDIGICHLTLAPEMVSPDVIRLLTDMGVIVSLGHSRANFEVAEAALAAGARGFTHLFNAMSPFQGREPGMVGAALLSRDSWCGLIVDGYHVHEASSRLAIELKQKGKVMLITDAMPPVGTDESEFELLGEKVIRTDGKLTASGGQLAGSVLDMASAVRNSVQCLGLPKEEALRMASLYPAEFLKIEQDTGTLEPGKRADFVLLDEDMNVMSSWVGGIKSF